MTITHFDYTARLNTAGSSALQSAYYNANDKVLAVALDGGTTYIYHGVPISAWNSFSAATSYGTHYAKEIKTNYGPAILSYPSANLVYRAVQTAVSHFPLSTPEPQAAVAAVAEPTPPSEPTPAAKNYDYEVKFLLQGLSVRRATLNAASVDDAVTGVREIGEMLGLELIVQSVTVHFV